MSNYLKNNEAAYYYIIWRLLILFKVYFPFHSQSFT